MTKEKIQQILAEDGVYVTKELPEVLATLDAMVAGNEVALVSRYKKHGEKEFTREYVAVKPRTPTHGGQNVQTSYWLAPGSVMLTYSIKGDTGDGVGSQSYYWTVPALPELVCNSTFTSIIRCGQAARIALQKHYNLQPETIYDQPEIKSRKRSARTKK